MGYFFAEFPTGTAESVLSAANIVVLDACAARAAAAVPEIAMKFRRERLRELFFMEFDNLFKVAAL
jgi:hypothetical protein